ncbi:MAG: ABC transporter permease [Myxococcaceae bacterium]
MNSVGAMTLLGKEVRRFLRVPGQTLLSPLISTTLYFLVFGYSVGGRVQEIHGQPYLAFIVPGLVFLGMANNAFLNSSSSFFITKIQGTVVDLLVAPLGPLELLFGFVTGAIVRGVMVGVLTYAVACFFTGFLLKHLLITLALLALVAYVFAVLGVLAGVWAEKFEQINFFPTFVMLPLTFLSGTFYSVDALPEPWRTVSLFNPMVYMVDGLRYGILGAHVTSAVVGGVMLVAVAIVSTGVAYAMLRTGYKLKA